MFICRRCTRIALAAPIHALPASHYGAASLWTRNSTTPFSRGRNYSTEGQAAAAAKSESPAPRVERRRNPRSIRTELQASKRGQGYKKDQPQERRNGSKDDSSSLIQQDDDGDLQAMHGRVKRTLANYKDPFMVAHHVKILLEKGRFKEALITTRQGSKTGNLVVSWNHLIKHLMDENKLKVAVKVYNEMKKRGQLPNAQTYTIIFKGCAGHHSPRTAVGEATRIYTSMMSHARLNPNTIHMNAVVQTCALAGDLESMFNILKTANSKMRSPDARTYTIIFNGLRYKTAKPKQPLVDDVETPDGNDPPHVSIARATSLWDEITTRWKNGSLAIDEEMVCAMARLLQTGGFAENEAVLALLEQTMNIPRYDKPEKDDGAKKITSGKGPELPKDDVEAESAEVSLQSHESPESIASSDAEAEIETPLEVTASKFPVLHQAKGLYAKPSNNTLSVLCTSLGAIKKTHAIMDYWADITRYGVVPDSNNYYQLFQCMRTAGKGASNAAVQMIQKMPAECHLPTFFRNAMSVCLYDLHNDKAFANAGKILDMANKSLRYPDANVLRIYLRVAIDNTAPFRALVSKGNNSGAREGFGQQILRALDRLWEPCRLLSNTLSYPTKAYKSPEEEFEDTYRARIEAIGLVRRMIAVTDKLQVGGTLQADELAQLRTRRNLLNRQATRFSEAKGKFKLSREMVELETREEATLLQERKHLQLLHFLNPSGDRQRENARARQNTPASPLPPRPQYSPHAKLRTFAAPPPPSSPISGQRPWH